MCKDFSPTYFLKRYVCQHCVAPKLANIPSCYVFWIQVIDANCIFSHSSAKLANMAQDKKLANIPPQPWRALLRRSTYQVHFPRLGEANRLLYVIIVVAVVAVVVVGRDPILEQRGTNSVARSVEEINGDKLNYLFVSRFV